MSKSIQAHDKSQYKRLVAQTAFMVERLQYIAETDDALYGGIRETLFDAISLLEQMSRMTKDERQSGGSRFLGDLEPQKQEWVGLTGVEVNHILAANVGYPERMMKEVEAKLKEKNR